jgi:YHS domain-containing protein
MLRLILFVLFAIFVARAFWRLFDGIVEGASGGRSQSRAPERGTSMVRDPVCGTFVLPASAVTLSDGRARLYFCSDACRDKYRAGPSSQATGSGRSEPVEGRRR